MKKMVIVFVLVLTVLIGVGAATGYIMTPTQYYRTHPDTSLYEGTPRVGLCIEFKSIANDGGEGLPDYEGGVILSAEYALTEGDSVFDILSRVLTYEDIPFGYSGTSNVYIRSIAGLSEFDCGAASGWVYLVNGKAPEVSCAGYFPKDGDEITFKYVDEYYNGGEDE